VKHLKQIVIVCIVLSFLVACGQKGDLYLPTGTASISEIG